MQCINPFFVFYTMARPAKPKTELAQRLIDVRGATPRDVFAKSLELVPGTYSNYERGDAEPSIAILQTIARNYGVNLHWLLTGGGGTTTDPSKAPKPAKQPAINQDMFRKVAQLVLTIHEAEGVKLPATALLDEQTGAYNALLSRAEDPTDQAELESLLPWLETKLKKALKSAAHTPGTGKREA